MWQNREVPTPTTITATTPTTIVFACVAKQERGGKDIVMIAILIVVVSIISRLAGGARQKYRCKANENDGDAYDDTYINLNYDKLAGADFNNMIKPVELR